MLSGVIHESRYLQLVEQAVDDVRGGLNGIRVLLILYQLRRLDVDIIAYQDEVGVRKSTPDQTGAYYRSLREAHDKAGRSRLWADMEVFEFEGATYRSALIPASIDRVEAQLRALSPWVDKILCYEYPGLLSRPGSEASYAGDEPARLYAEYERLKNR